MSATFLLRRVSKNFIQNNSNLFRARAQHDSLSKGVVAAATEYIVLPGAENFPESCFVGDTCVAICKGVVAATMPFDTNRQGETGLMRNFFDSCEMYQQLEHIYRFNSEQKCDGSNVLRIAKNIFVGANDRSSASAHLYWQEICKRHKINYVPVPIKDSCTLQSRVAWLGRDAGLFCCLDAHDCAKLVSSHIDFDRKKIRFVNKVDLLRIGNNILHSADCDLSFYEFADNFLKKKMDLGAMGKKDAVLARSVATILLN